MKIIIKYDEATCKEAANPATDILPSVINWAQRDNNNKVGAMFEVNSGTYEVYKYNTKTGTKVVDVRTYKRCKDITS